MGGLITKKRTRHFWGKGDIHNYAAVAKVKDKRHVTEKHQDSQGENSEVVSEQDLGGARKNVCGI